MLFLKNNFKANTQNQSALTPLDFNSLEEVSGGYKFITPPNTNGIIQLEKKEAKFLNSLSFTDCNGKALIYSYIQFLAPCDNPVSFVGYEEIKSSTGRKLSAHQVCALLYGCGFPPSYSS